MKNNALKLISLAVLAPMMTACPKPQKETKNWKQDVQDAMVLYAGEVLPFAELNEETLVFGYDADYLMFYLYDDNEVNVLENYSEALVAAGFEEVSNEVSGETYITYDKLNELGAISVSFGFDEGDDETLPGNFINVAVPEYLDEDLLDEYGYDKQTGWPEALVGETLGDSGIVMAPVNATGEWWVADDLYVDEEDGSSYMCAYLATKGDYFDAIYDDLTEKGLDYYETYGCFYDPTFGTDAEIYVSIVRDFTIINVYGPTLGPAPVDYTIQGDGLTQESFGLTDGGTTYAEHTATGASGASYTAQCASAHGIQIRSKNNNSGIIGNNSSKTAESITIVFDAETGSSGNERTVDIYASNSPFTIADMYGTTLTAVGSISYSASNLVQSYTFTTDYHYIGLRSNSGAIYMTIVDVVWSD